MDYKSPVAAFFVVEVGAKQYNLLGMKAGRKKNGSASCEIRPNLKKGCTQGLALLSATYRQRSHMVCWRKVQSFHLFWQGILRNVPHATLGTLIFPGINIIFTVLGSIGILTILSML
ncbi:hypothetical protein ABER98_06490 [Domibacillus aminovorans]|uniref:Uncharacterized protein n=1 Tax=Domibacillus aminovorans TaxID=29332 RepID=A0A177LDB6_9BACI|nr:hypothetical protein [Domibacillus aminovorans]OAH63327.1 hypothetical protein AWH49_00290 [Domibacillus aminovorans]